MKMTRQCTIKLLAVPSLMIWVALSAFANSPQNNAAISPACIAVNITSGFVPCLRMASVVRSWKGRVRRYKIGKMGISIQPDKQCCC